MRLYITKPINLKPPRFADRLEEVPGDLHEEFDYQVRRIGERRARWCYVWDILRFC